MPGTGRRLADTLYSIARTAALPAVRRWPMWLMLTVMLGYLGPLRVAQYMQKGWGTPQEVAAFFLPMTAMAFIEAYMLTWVACLVNRRWCSGLIYAFGLGWFVLTYALQHVLQMRVSPTTLMLLLDTNPGEASGFLQAFARMPNTPDVLWYAAVLVVTTLLLRRHVYPYSLPLVKRRWFAVAVTALLVADIVCATPSIASVWRLTGLRNLDDHALWSNENPTTMASDPLQAILYSMRTVQLQGRVLDPWAERQRAFLAAAGDSVPPAPVNIVLVIGESHTRAHSGCYGYRLPTTPWQTQAAQEGSLVLLSDMVSTYPATIQAVRNMMCLNSVGDGEHWYESDYFPAVFRAKGWEVDYFDNQYIPTGDHNTYDITLASMVYHPVLAKDCYRRIADSVYPWDTDYLASLPPVDTVHPTLTILHLHGQHMYYESPEAYHVFSAEDYAWRHEPWLDTMHRQLIAHYDNSTLYNDEVLRRIARRWSHTPTIVLYVSDHGEDLYDSGDVGPRDNQDDPHMPPQRVRALNDVAAWVWMSPPLMSQRPGLADSLRRAAGRPALSDNVGQILMGLAGIRDTAYYRPSRDLFSPSYRCPPRIINAGYSYDSVTGRH